MMGVLWDMKLAGKSMDEIRKSASIMAARDSKVSKAALANIPWISNL